MNLPPFIYDAPGFGRLHNKPSPGATPTCDYDTDQQGVNPHPKRVDRKEYADFVGKSKQWRTGPFAGKNPERQVDKQRNRVGNFAATPPANAAETSRAGARRAFTPQSFPDLS